MSTMGISEISKMTTKERLHTMELLWDALSHEPKDLESPHWHRDVLLARKRRIDSGNAEFVTIDEVKERFRK